MNKEKMKLRDPLVFAARLRNPSTSILSGPSNSGKTTLLYKILNHGGHIFHDPRCLQNSLFLQAVAETL